MVYLLLQLAKEVGLLDAKALKIEVSWSKWMILLKKGGSSSSQILKKLLT